MEAEHRKYVPRGTIPDLKIQQHQEIDQLTQAYLANGGEIQQVDHTANKSYKTPIKRDRSAQVDHQKRTWNLTPPK